MRLLPNCSTFWGPRKFKNGPPPQPKAQPNLTDEEAIRLVTELENRINDKPLQSDLLEMIPIANFKHSKSQSIEMRECSICHDSFE